MSTATLHGNPAIPEAEHSIPPSSQEAMDLALTALQQGKHLWPRMSLKLRIALIEESMDLIKKHGQEWVDASLKAKGITPGTPAEGEEWLGGPMITMRTLRLTRKSLQDIKDYGHPRLPKKPYTRPDGQVVAPVFPNDLFERGLYTGFTAEVWMEPGVTLDNLHETMGVIYRQEQRTGKVALVLGAGNVSSIGPLDAYYKLFVEDQVVVLKMNPVNEYLGPIFEKIFAPFLELDLFRIVYGGAKEGSYLCHHDAVDEIHITGSDKTHDAIVYGTGEEGARRKAENNPILTKRITSELGNVSPVIVVPGPWKEGDFAFQGANIASMLTNNAGFNCNALRMIIQHEQWDLKDGLLHNVEQTLKHAPNRLAYYPGARDRYKAFLDAHPDAHTFGADDDRHVPWTIVRNVDPSQPDDICFRTEAFCGVAGETNLAASSVPEYIAKAVAFCNEQVWGTLSASIIVHPESMKDPAIKAAVEKAVADLRYGSVAVNHWAALSYAFGSTTWGAFPGHTLQDIRSGIGVVHNSYLFDRPQKSVIWGPFKVTPKPAWFVSNKVSHILGKKMLDFEHSPSAVKLASVATSALRDFS